MSEAALRRRVVVGVDTHKYVHVAVGLDEFGGRIDAQRFTADSIGYRNLIDWAAGLGRLVTFGIEGTGSYGAGLASAVRRRGFGSIEVLRTDRAGSTTARQGRFPGCRKRRSRCARWLCDRSAQKRRRQRRDDPHHQGRQRRRSEGAHRGDDQP
jgi:hypothetical protein